MDPKRDIIIDYTNYKGVRATRRVSPLFFTYEATEHHPERQWLMSAYDHEKKANRTFAMRDIHSWKDTNS